MLSGLCDLCVTSSDMFVDRSSGSRQSSAVGRKQKLMASSRVLKEGDGSVTADVVNRRL